MIRKTAILKAFVRQRWGRQPRNRDELEKLQLKLLKRQQKFLVRNSPYFQDLPTVTSLNCIQEWPMMDKQVMMVNFDSMNTAGLKRDVALELAIHSEKVRKFDDKYADYSVGLSSGTSGHRGLFVISDQEREEWAGTVLAYYLPRGKLSGHRAAFFLRADNNLYQTVGSKVLSFRYFDIYKNMDQNLAELDNYNPSILIAPPSVLLFIADAKKDKRLTINPALVISVAEVLQDADAKYIRKHLHQKIIHQIYQCTEGFLAHTCVRGTLHLNEDSIIIEKEYVDRARFIPIVTDLKRKTQPIVRYRLNDILVGGRPCRCGSPLQSIRRIEGREGDVFIFTNSAGKTIKVFSDMIARCMLYAGGYHEYRVVQDSPRQMTVYLDNVDNNTKKEVLVEFAQLSRMMEFDLPVIKFATYRHDLSHKLRRIEKGF